MEVAVKISQATIEGPYNTFICVTWSDSISLERSVPAVMEPSRIVADNDDTCGPIVVKPSRRQGPRRVQPWRLGNMESAVDAEARQSVSTWRMGMASGETPVPKRQARHRNWDIIGRSPSEEPFSKRLRLPSWQFCGRINLFPEADMPIWESHILFRKL
jgi:hypothetical protein